VYFRGNLGYYTAYNMLRLIQRLASFSCPSPPKIIVPSSKSRVRASIGFPPPSFGVQKPTTRNQSPLDPLLSPHIGPSWRQAPIAAPCPHGPLTSSGQAPRGYGGRGVSRNARHGEVIGRWLRRRGRLDTNPELVVLLYASELGSRSMDGALPCTIVQYTCRAGQGDEQKGRWAEGEVAFEMLASPC
jgi:hypothetical protein